MFGRKHVFARKLCQCISGRLQSVKTRTIIIEHRSVYGFSAPFSEDFIPTKIRNECDYSQKITLSMAKNGLAPRSVRVYADGAFDLFHQGHARALMQVKKALPNVYLIVGVSNDSMVQAMKGPAVMSEEERYGAVCHCRYVDEVLRNAPWEYTDDFLAKYKIDFVAHDAIPYKSGNTDDTYGELKKRGMFLETERTKGVSTSDIVARIVKNYDVYARRNLARGYSAQELNVSYIKEKTYKFQDKIEELKNRGKKYVNTVEETTDNIIIEWKENDFLTYFVETSMQFLKKFKNNFLKAVAPSGTSPLGNEDKEDFSPPKNVRRDI